MNSSDAILQAILQLDHKVQQLDHKLEHGLQGLQRDCGDIVERQLQDAISRQFGGRYSKQLLARSIVDLCHMFPEETFDRRANKAAGALAFISPATQVGRIGMTCAIQYLLFYLEGTTADLVGHVQHDL